MRIAYPAIVLVMCSTVSCGSGPSASESDDVIDEQRSEVRRRPKPCTGRGNATCAENEYCRSAMDERCPSERRAGVCAVRPEVCTEIFDPVCGCDNVTYPNACYAARSGAAVATRGACAAETCQTNDACAEAQYCQKTATQCGSAGTCASRPQACTRIYRPVCGCDGKTYGNECEAAATGASVAHEGVCPAPAPFCGGIAGFPCAGGATCVDDPSDSCDPTQGGADCSGVCACLQQALCVAGWRFDPSPLVCACVPEVVDPCSLVRCAAGTHCVVQGGAAVCAPAARPTCGSSTCAAGQVCCNASCGICTPPGGACIQLACN